MANPTITVNVGSIDVSASAFAELLRATLDAAGIPISTSANINLVISLGAGVRTIAPGAFASATSTTGLTTLTASVVFAARTATDPISIGNNAFGNLPVSTLALPAQTTLQANALTNMTHLTNLDVSALTTPLASNSLNLNRSTTGSAVQERPLVLLMPTASVSYSTNTVVLPTSTAGTSSNTVVFNGSVPSATQLQTLFTAPSSSTVPVQIAINYETTSNVSAEQITALRTALAAGANGTAVPQAVSYTSVVAASITTLGALTGVSQFAGDYFNYLQINSTECIVTGLTQTAISNNVGTIPVPAVITPKNTTSNLNAVAIASRMSIGTSDNVYYTFDNYYNEAVSAVPLVALVNANNGMTTETAFTPAIVCNGVINVSEIDGTITFTGSTATVNGVPAYCVGYDKSSATFTTLIGATNGFKLYDKNGTSPIGSISQSNGAFTITFSKIKETTLSQTILNGAFQSNTAITTVDFTSMSHAAQMTWSSFSTAVGAVISTNNSLSTLIAQVLAYPAPNGYTYPTAPTFAPGNNTITAELSALNYSNTNVLSKWKAVKDKYALYYAYLGASAAATTSLNTTSFYKYVADVATALQNGAAGPNPHWAAARTMFQEFQNSLAIYIPALNLALNSTNGTLYPIVAAYQSSRFQIGNQTFRSCTSILNIIAFELLQNLVKVNMETFYSCSSIQTSIAIPKNVETIHVRAFWVCSVMTGLNLQNASALRTIEKEAFKSCSGLRGSLSFSSAIYALNSVETIGDYAFSGCSGLTDHLYFPPGLKSLGVGAFQDCSGLNGTIVFPSNANFTTIPDNAFARCSNLTGISNNTGNQTSLQYLPITGSTNPIPNGLLIPASVTSIGASAFTGCVKFAGALNLQTGLNIQQIKQEAFKNCVAFTSLLLPNVAQYTTVESNCFNGCTGFKSVSFPSAVTTIMDGAFRGCSAIASKLNLDNVQYILANAFSACSSLSGALTLGANLYALGDNAFSDCAKITSVTFLGAPTKNITTTALIFGLTVASSVSLYINVFVENGWTALLGSAAGTLRISSVFRNGATGGSPVQTSLIDFKIPTPANDVTDITINQFQGFIVLTNAGNGTNGDNLAIQTQAADAKQWIDVCIPGVLKGYDATTANTNAAINPSALNVLPKLNSLIDVQQTDSYTALQAALNVSSAVNGTNISIEAGIDFTGITVKEIPSLPYTVGGGDVLPFYGLVNAAGSNKLYYAATNGTVIPADATALVTTVGANVQFYVKAATGTNATQYANKIIQVNSTGVISISRITVLGLNTGALKVNDYSSGTVVLPATNAVGYSIVNTTTNAATNEPKLYFQDVLADARAYYIAKGGPGTGTGIINDNYLSAVFYVNYQGTIYKPANQLQLIYVAAANESTVMSAPTAANTYSIVGAVAANPGNTVYTLYVGNGAATNPAAAPVTLAGSYYIKTSDLAIFNETIITVNSSGGISIGSVGLSGASNSFTRVTYDLSIQSIPIYNTNQKSINLDYFLNKTDLPVAVSQFDVTNAALVSAISTLDTDNKTLNSAINTKYPIALPASLIAANTATNVKVAAFLTSAPLNDTQVANDYILATSTIAIAQGQFVTIQKSTLATINDFILKSSYAAAATASAPAGSAAPTTLAYIQSTIESFAVGYLTYQNVNRGGDFIINTVTLMNTKNGYSNTSGTNPYIRIERNLADYAALIINNWFASAGGGNGSWQASLYSLQPNGTATSVSHAQYLAWFQATVATPLTIGGNNTVYQQFLTARPVPTLTQVAVAIAAYETSRLVPANDATANLAAQAAYIAGGVYPNATVHDKTDVGVCAKSVYDAYYTLYGPNTDISGIKNYMKYLATTLSAFIVTLSAKCATLETNAFNLIESVDTLNVAYDQAVVAESNAYNLAHNASGSITEQLNGIRARLRIANLFTSVLNNPTGGTSSNIVPAFSTLPAYESEWYKSQLDAFVAAADKTVATASTAYTAATTALLTKKEALQVAEINSFFANYPPSSDVVSPVTQTVVRENVFKCLTTINAYLASSANDTAFVQNVVSPAFIAYVAGRDAAIGTQTGANRLSAITAYQQGKISATGTILATARSEYGITLYKQYLAAIYLVIAQLYSSTSTSATAYNPFKNAVGNYHRPPTGGSQSTYFAIISQLINGQLYTGASTTYYGAAPTTYVLFGNTATSSLATEGGQLYNNLNSAGNGYAIANAITNVATIPMTAYGTTAGAASPLAISVAQYATAITSTNNANIAVATAAQLIVGSYEYAVTALDNLPSAAIPNALTITGAAGTDKLYDFLLGGTRYYGYAQSATLNNSWSNLSSNESVVFLYQITNTADNLALLLSASKTGTATFMDDAKYVIVIKPAVAPASGSTFVIYTYDAFGVSGSFVYNGTITGTTALTAVVTPVTGPFQLSTANLSVSLVGDLTISNKIKTVGVNAFAASTSIKSVSFINGANTAVSIGSNAFADCTGLTSVALGPTISSIGPSAFLNCSGLTSIVLPSNPSFTVIDHFVFNGCSNLGSDLVNGNLVIPAAVSQINVQSFARCVKLVCQQLNGVSSYIGPNVKKIGFGAFLNCIGLTGPLNLNNIVDATGARNSSLAFVGTAAFMGCTGFNGALSVPINPAYVNILPYTFSSVDAPLLGVLGAAITPNPPYTVAMKLSSVVDLSSTNVATIGRCAFYKCSLLEGVVLSSNVSDIGIQAFKSCIGLLGALLIPASVNSIGSGAFQGCIGISGLTIVSTTVSQTASTAWLSIGSFAFQGCSALSNSNTAQGLYIPNTVLSLGDSAFQDCTSISSVTIGSGLTAANSFGKSVFAGCTKLARVILAFSFVSSSGVGAGTASVVSGAATLNNNSFADCTALGVVGATQTPTGTVQIQSGATGWTPGRAVFFNYLTVVITNKNIQFYLQQFNQNITVVDPAKDTVVIEPLPITDAQATVYVKASDMRKVFRTSTDSFMNQSNPTSPRVEHGQMFFVLPEYFPKYLNVANARVSQGGIESYNSAMYEQLVKDDVMRYYAMSLFQSADWVTLFANDVEMLENMVASSGLMPVVPDGDVDAATGKNQFNTGALHNIMTLLNNISYTTAYDATHTSMVMATNVPTPTSAVHWWALPDNVLPENGNIGKKLFDMINRNDPGRITSMVQSGSTPMELPFLAGDQFIFVFTLNGKTVSLPGMDPVAIKTRTYMIKMILTDDFNSGTSAFTDHALALYQKPAINLNVLPVGGAYVADYMYSDYDLFLAIKPSLADSSSYSVYGKVTSYGSYEPIQNVPRTLQPFTGWYYSYPTNTQAIQLDFTPKDAANIVYRDMRYLSAYVYFPTAWTSTSVKPTENNYPYWTVVFSTGGGSTVTLNYVAKYLTTGGDVVNFLGQSNQFDYTNNHIQLLAPFDISSQIGSDWTNGNNVPFNQSVLNGNNGASPTPTYGAANTISGTDIWVQKSTTVQVVNGLRQPSSSVGPFSYPPVARGYQCIPMPTNDGNSSNPLTFNLGSATALTTGVKNALLSTTSIYKLKSVTLNINMRNVSGYVPSVIVKSVEVVAKNYEAYYLAPMDPNP